MSSWIFEQVLWLLGIYSIVLLMPVREVNANLLSGTRSKPQADAICAVTDTSLFAAAVRWIQADLTASEKRKRPLRIDPRPLLPSAKLPLDESDFGRADSLVPRRRTVLQRVEGTATKCAHQEAM